MHPRRPCPTFAVAVRRAAILPLFGAALAALAAHPVSAQTNPCAGRDVNAIQQAEAKRPGSQRNDPCVRWLLQQREELRREIVAEQHGGVDPCPGQAPEAALASYVEMPPGCDRLGAELVQRLQARAAAASAGAGSGDGSARPIPESRGPSVLGGSEPAPGPREGAPDGRSPPLSDSDAEKALREALADRELTGKSVLDLVEGMTRPGAAGEAFMGAAATGARFFDELVRGDPAMSSGSLNAQERAERQKQLREQYGASIKAITAIAAIAALRDWDGKPLFPATSAMMPVAIKLAQSGGKDPDALLTLERMKALLVRMDAKGLEARKRTALP